ncbi:Uncharacterised protein [Algoriella xinjiangensis]|uniref:hypothetical protein n=1 Tax=Algoriella xinjiangensis TaxID=684065 RepID=UPI000F63A08F|nr:hypothetical protein [Algoriella xinjiangensis]VDH15481.1 Uncharacterised protein [Algoriella xinjiangensis]
MKLILKIGSIVALATVLFTSCESKTSERIAETTESKRVSTNIVQDNNSKKGEHVPNNLVCMVNDAYMGKEQIEVPFEGKMYYGCCNMCKEKIPKDESVRYAIDPHSLKKISKADAYIVVIGNNDEVAYFESEENYQQFLKENA